MRHLEKHSELVKSVEGSGFKISDYTEEPHAFDNFVVTISNGSRTYRIIRDRSQFTLDGDREAIEAAGLWKAFDSEFEFRACLTKFLRCG